jgi:ABC-2 type transport system permease protein
MKELTFAIIAEYMKIKRSRIFLITVAIFIFIPCMLGLMIYVTNNPQIGSRLGIIGTKASVLRFGNTDFRSYFNLINQVVSAIGMVGFGFVTSWVFGREYSDHTIKDILALPVSRAYIVIAKFTVIVAWCFLLSIVLFVTSLLIGLLVSIPGLATVTFPELAGMFSFISFLTILLCTPAAFFACLGKGYLLPLGFVILVLIIANFTGLAGIGPYFPWSVPGLIAAASDETGLKPVVASYVILFLTSGIGFFATLFWWRFADQN